MDPDVALDTILAWAHDMNEDGENDYDAWDIAELVIGLDQWIRRGGFLPQPWEAARYEEIVRND